MKKKWILAAAFITVVVASSGTWLHASYAASHNAAPISSDVNVKEASDGDGEVADDQEASDGDGEVANDQVASDGDGEVADDQEASDGDGEIAEDQEQSDSGTTSSIQEDNDVETNED